MSTTSLLPELARGVIVDAWRLDEQLGEGGMGTVWSATRGDERAALKFLRVDGTSARRRFLAEARASRAVDHPNVRAVRGVIELPSGAPALVMELLEGEPLAALLAREKKLSIEATAAILVPVVSAVGRAHAEGVVHRDLKPENVFLVAGADGAARGVKVLDFGIAKWSAHASGVDLESMGTKSGALLGTPFYMAPEQVFGERRVDHRADVWALGVVLYQCLSGVLPTRAENLGQVMKLIVSRSFKPLAERAPEVPAPVRDLVERMLARRPDDRPSSMREIADVLEAYTDVRAPAFGAPRVDALEPADDADALASGTTLGDSIDEAPPRPSRPVHDELAAPRATTRLRPLGIAAGVVVAALGSVVLWTQLSEPRSSARAGAATPASSELQASSVVALSEPAAPVASSAVASSAVASTASSASASSASAWGAEPTASARSSAPPNVAKVVDRAPTAKPATSAPPAKSAFTPDEKFQ